MAVRNYTLGRGRVLFARFTDDETPGRFRYVGNTPELNFNVESETLDHNDRGAGVTRIDDSVVLSVTRSGTLTMDDIQRENLALFFFGDTSSMDVTAATGQAQVEDGVKIDEIIQLGISDTDRVGIRNVEHVMVVEGVTLFTPTWASNGVVYSSANAYAANQTARDGLVKAATSYAAPAAGTPTVALFEVDADSDPQESKVTYMTWDGSANWEDADTNRYTEDTHYELDAMNGTIEFLALLDSSNTEEDVNVFYNVAGGAFEQVIAGSQAVEGAMRFVEDNPKGLNNQWVFPKVSVSPNGDVALKSNEWRTIPFSLRILDPSSGSAIYINGDPAQS